eukprot:06135.XXX_44541_44660_1 [CDS] Oithona nana genome sequencing.
MYISSAIAQMPCISLVLIFKVMNSFFSSSSKHTTPSSGL